jgi:hypothetical protein
MRPDQHRDSDHDQHDARGFPGLGGLLEREARPATSETRILTTGDILLIVYRIFCVQPAKAKSKHNKRAILRF